MADEPHQQLSNLLILADAPIQSFYLVFLAHYIFNKIMSKRLEQGQTSLIKNRKELVSAISILLKMIVDRNTDCKRSPSIFDLKFVSSLTISQYFDRLSKMLKCSNQVLVITVIYLDRFQSSVSDDFCIDRLSIFKILLTAMVIAIKFQDDEYYTNEFYAKAGGISLKELNQMEAKMTEIMGFSFYVEEQEFKRYINKLVRFYGSHKEE